MQNYTIDDKKIKIGDHYVSALAEKYGTPLYVYDQEAIVRNYRKAFNAFKFYYDKVEFFYAIKACNNPAIATILKNEGAGIDAASINEIKLAKKIGLTGNKIIFSGNFLSDEDVIAGIQSGAILNLDDISLLSRVVKYKIPELISFRVNPGYGRSNVGDYVTNAGPNAKFGIHQESVTEAYRKAKGAGVKRFGVHMMTGSCVTDSEYFSYVTKLLMDIVGKTSQELGIEFEFVDIGGGLGIPYKDSEKELDIDKTAKLVVSAFKKAISKYKMSPPSLFLEPARYFVGNAGFLIGQVHSIKNSYSKIIGTDIGINILARPALYGAYHDVIVDGRVKDEKVECGLCGQLCENTDLWIKNRSFPKTIQEGDIMVVTNAGAYGYSMSYQYNGRLKCAEVLLNKDESYLIREREVFDDMIRNTSVPEYLTDISRDL